MEGDEIKCPRCGKALGVDSVRKHVDGRVRKYWECKDCNLSVMHRDSG